MQKKEATNNSSPVTDCNTRIKNVNHDLKERHLRAKKKVAASALLIFPGEV